VPPAGLGLLPDKVQRVSRLRSFACVAKFAPNHYKLSLTKGRATYVMDGRGYVKHYLKSMMKHVRHVDSAIGILNAFYDEQ
jgi:peroxiredoxin